MVDGGGGVVDLAHDGPKRPLGHGHGHNEKGDADEEALVRNGQVEDVHVGHGVHLREPQHHIDHQGVANQS